MNDDKVILTDCDGVLLDWDHGFKKFMTEEFCMAQAPNTDQHYRLALRYPEMDDAGMNNLVKTMNTSKRVGSLEPIDGAVDAVIRLKNDGYRFVVITALSDHPKARKYRASNLDAVFGTGVFDHNEMICINPCISKQEALSFWQGSGHYWLEDHFSNAEIGYELGLKSLLFDQPYNRAYQTSLFPRVNGWDEAYSIITKNPN